MSNSLQILFISSECSPFAKAGGLGDFAGALPVCLKKLGHNVIIVIPKYSSINIEKYKLEVAIENMKFNIGNEDVSCKVFKTTIDEHVPVFFIDYIPFFGRSNMYHENDFSDYHDNPKRFTFLSKAALQLCYELNYKPDIVHANDWHTAVIPAYLKRLYQSDPLFLKSASLLTIHNLAYQGRYASYYYDYIGLGSDDFTSDKFECHRALNFLKAGIHFADMVNTVSPGYAAETITKTGGFGLDYYLRAKGEKYVGILNGADYSQWDPAVDKLIPANYSVNNLEGKKICKKSLQKQFGLKISGSIPIIGIISRLVEQKGFYILSECINGMINDFEAQFVILGAGESGLENYYYNLPQKHPGKVGSFIGYNNELAHLIEAGCDFFLMPSIYEPCGLNQIYSLRYGTLPIVRATGGLNDTVENYDQSSGNGTGFKFLEPSSKAIYYTVKWALETYKKRKSHIVKLRANAMLQDYSWEKSAKKYIDLYKKAIKNKEYQ